MNKIKVILLISVFLAASFTVVEAKQTKHKMGQQQLMRNRETISKLYNLGRVYRTTNNATVKAGTDREITQYIDTWYMENIAFISQAYQKKHKKDKEKGKLTMEKSKKLKEDLALKIKKGQIPNIMVMTLPKKDARVIKQKKMMAKAKKKNKDNNKKRSDKKGFFKKLLKK